MKLDCEELGRILDIEPPFLMVDELIDFVPMLTAHAIKHFDCDDWFMKCHLTRAPVMPGTLQTELMLQTFALLIYLSSGHSIRHSFVRSFDTTCFRKLERKDSGCVLHAKVSILENKRGIVKGEALLSIGKILISSSKITMVLPDAMPVPRLL